VTSRATLRGRQLALARGFAQSVYRGRELVGRVHATPRGFIAENAAGEKIGKFRTSKDAAHAIVLSLEPAQ
jgi:hypothetical protein